MAKIILIDKEDIYNWRLKRKKGVEGSRDSR